MFRTDPLSIIRGFALYTQQYAQVLLTPCCSQAVSKPVWHIPLLCVQWKTPDDGQRNCTKHVVVYSKNKFEKLGHLGGFIIRICKIKITKFLYAVPTHLIPYYLVMWQVMKSVKMEHKIWLELLRWSIKWTRKISMSKWCNTYQMFGVQCRHYEWTCCTD